MGKDLEEIARLVLNKRKQSITYKKALKSYNIIIDSFKNIIQSNSEDKLITIQPVDKETWSVLSKMLEYEGISYNYSQSKYPDYYLITAYIEPLKLEEAIGKVLEK